jgi:hypothetical protein
MIWPEKSRIYGAETIAFPHCRCDLTENLWARSRSIIVTFADAVDKICMSCFASGATFQPREYFDVLGRINSIGSYKAMRLQLCGCGSADGVNRLLRKLDSENDFLANDTSRKTFAQR